MTELATLILLGIGFLLSPVLHAEVLPPPEDPLSRVRILNDIDQKSDGYLSVHLLSDFETDPGWKISGDSPLRIFRPIYRTPENEAFFVESQILRETIDPGFRYEKGFFLHTSFINPGRDFFRACLTHPVKIQGRLRSVSLWAHTRPSLHTLSLVVSTGEGKRENIEFGRLQWNGWKRLETSVPPGLFKTGERGKLPSFQLECLQVQSSRMEKPGDVSLIFDNMIAIVENPPSGARESLRYDGW